MRRLAARPEVLAAAAAVWVLALAVVGVDQALAHLAPVVLLVLPLLAGRYPGEHALCRTRCRRTHRRRRLPSAVTPSLPFVAITPRGGRLVAASLAGRGPPGVEPFDLAF